MKKSLIIFNILMLLFGCIKKREEINVELRVLKKIKIEINPTTFRTLYNDSLFVYGYLRSPVFVKNIKNNKIDTLGSLGEGPGEFTHINDFVIKNDILFLIGGGKKFVIFSIKEFKLIKELNLIKLFNILGSRIIKIINDSLYLLQCVDLNKIKTSEFSETYPFFLIDLKNKKIICKFYAVLKYPNKRWWEILSPSFRLPKSLVFFNDSVFFYDYIRDEINFYDLNRSRKKKIKIKHKDFRVPPVLYLKEIDKYVLPFDPSKGVFKKDSFLILFVMNEWKNAWNTVKKTAERFSGFTEEEKKEFNLLIDYISLKNMKHIGTFVFPDSLWKKEIVYYPVKIEMENDTFKGYFYSTERKELKVIFFKLEEGKL